MRNSLRLLFPRIGTLNANIELVAAPNQDAPQNFSFPNWHFQLELQLLKPMLYIKLLVLVLLLPLTSWAQRAGDLDRSFNYGRGENFQFNQGYGANGIIYTSIVQPNGKIIIGGRFTKINGVTMNRIARLNSDGNLDTTFNIGAGFNGYNEIVRVVTLQSDGKILVAGDISLYNGNYRNNLFRLHPDGRIDSSFNPPYVNNRVFSIKQQMDGKVLIGGDFQNSPFDTRLNRIARLNSDGSIDTTFNTGTGANDRVHSINIDSSGKIIIAGEFISINGIQKYRIARLNINGSLDNTFNTGIGANNTIQTISLQSDGKLIVGGYFTSFNGVLKRRIARLNSNGSLDNSFNITGASDTSILSLNVVTTLIQADGKILIGGQFLENISPIYSKIFRLQTDGSIDTTFHTMFGASGFNPFITSLSINSNNKIIVSGNFTNYDNNVNEYIACLNSDGSLNTNFNIPTGPNYSLNSVVVQQDGKILITGLFNRYNNFYKNALARLNTDGSLDTTFNIGTGPGNTRRYIASTVLQQDGKILVFGSFNSFNGSFRNLICRLNNNGSLDTTFNTSFGESGQVLSVALQPDGKIIVGGDFLRFNGMYVSRIARLNSNGRLDTTFNSGTGANDYVNSITLQPDGKIIIGGRFTSFNGISRNNVARINTNGSLDGSFIPEMGIPSSNVGVMKTLLQPDGKLIVGGETTYNGSAYRRSITRLNSDGSLDTTFMPGRGPNSYVYSLLLQPDGRIIVIGDFTSYNSTERNNIVRINSNGSIDTSINFSVIPYSTLYSAALQPNRNIIIGGSFTGYNNLSTPYIARIHGNDCPPIANPTISGDTILCSGNTVRLSSSSPVGNLWNTGDTTQFITVAQAGTYSVRVILGVCTSVISPTITVSLVPTPLVPQIYASATNLVGSDSCTITIATVAPNTIYEWTNGAFGNQITVRTADTISVRSVVNGCTSAFSEPIIVTNTTNKVQRKIFQVFPNPATDKVTIKTNGPGKIEIVNMVGQLVIAQTVTENNEINISKLSRGVYSIKFNGSIQKLVVK